MRLGRRGFLVAGVVALLLLLVGGGALASFAAELLWYRSVRLEDVFWTHWRAAVLVRGLAAVLIAAAVFLNLWIVTRSLGAIRVRRRYGNIEIAERLPNSYVVGAVALVSLLSAWWLSAGVSDPLPILAAIDPEPWGLRESAFGLDASFYVFRLPILVRVQTLAALVVFWVGLLSVAAYVATGAIKFDDGRPAVSRLARRHLGLLVSAFLLLFAVIVWLDRYGLVIDGTGFGGALGYTDVNARIPAKAIVFVVVLLVAAGVGYGAWAGNPRIALLTGALLPIAIVGAEFVYPSSIQRLLVEPNQFLREEPFIEQHLQFTRAAYGLHEVEQVPLPYDDSADLTADEVLARLRGVPLWDPRPLLTTFSQRQGLFPYYAFLNVHHDRYPTREGIEPVAVAVRELETSELEDAAQTWQNLHLNYVAGAGAVASPVARMSSTGTPVFYVWDLDPPKLSPDAPPQLELRNPAIFFGERSTEYVILGPDREPFGITLDSGWKKLLFAWAFRSKNILLSGEVTSDSKIVFRRRITERVQAAAPFLQVPREQNGNPVILDGRVVWIVDGFTTSPTFPLTPIRPFQGRGVRYVRNSVKATVDALTGEVRLYALDPDDPILVTYGGIFPGLVRPLDELPEGLQRHLRYPLPLVQLQAQVLGAYHLLDPRTFYAQQDVWSIATEQYQDQPAVMEPTFAVLPLPGEQTAEFLLTLPFTARGRQNMTALLITRNDPPHYGEQRLYLFPRDELVPGPQQIEAAVDQDPEIAQQLALWRRGGSGVLRGHLMIVPVRGTIVYVEPLFLEAQTSAIPQLERVILARAGRVVMRPTFEGAVSALLDGDLPPSMDEGNGAPETVASPSSLLRAAQLLDEAEALLRAGDWAGFGRALESLREALRDAAETP